MKTWRARWSPYESYDGEDGNDDGEWERVGHAETDVSDYEELHGHRLMPVVMKGGLWVIDRLLVMWVASAMSGPAALIPWKLWASDDDSVGLVFGELDIHRVHGLRHGVEWGFDLWKMRQVGALGGLGPLLPSGKPQRVKFVGAPGRTGFNATSQRDTKEIVLACFWVEVSTELEELVEVEIEAEVRIAPAAKTAAVPKVSVPTPPAYPPDPKITAPKTPPKNPPKPPASRQSQESQAAVIPKVPPKSALTSDPIVDLPRSVLLYSPDTFSRCNFRVEDSQRLEGKVVVFDFHNVIDRYYWAPRVGQRKQQYKIPYPNEAPELLSDVQGLLRRVHRAAEEAGALVVICSHIGEGSRSIEDWALDTLRNTFIQSVGQRQADLVIITRSRTGRLGKLDICRRLFQQPSLLIIDDNTGICEEWSRSANAAAFHIQLPRRDLPSIGRSFSSIFEAARPGKEKKKVDDSDATDLASKGLPTRLPEKGIVQSETRRNSREIPFAREVSLSGNPSSIASAAVGPVDASESVPCRRVRYEEGEKGDAAAAGTHSWPLAMSRERFRDSDSFAMWVWGLDLGSCDPSTAGLN
ncbi:lactb2 [Symbiodinium sp. CCMP2592]|nr:lactb2 [Symbiodinium sp. CCMP2592]